MLELNFPRALIVKQGVCAVCVCVCITCVVKNGGGCSCLSDLEQRFAADCLIEYTEQIDTGEWVAGLNSLVFLDLTELQAGAIHTPQSQLDTTNKTVRAFQEEYDSHERTAVNGAPSPIEQTSCTAMEYTR